MQKLSAADILVLHAMVIEATGGGHGVRDPHLLASIAEKPYAQFGGNDLYPTLWNKAAVLFEGLVNYHVFVDGNKRTGLMVTARFLHLHGIDFIASNEGAEYVAIAIATKALSTEALAAWLEKNCRISTE